VSLSISGVSVPFQDAAIAAVAIEYGLELWTNDRYYKKIADLIPDLILFRP
jgi:predicted nucleic acid-binding protein